MIRFSLPMQMTCLSLACCTQLYAQDTLKIAQDTAEAPALKLDETFKGNQSIKPDQTFKSDEVMKLDTIVVTASRSAQSIADIAGTVYQIPREKIEQQASAGKSTADILSILVPSLTAGTGTTSNYGISMRGRVVQYMIDGVPQTGSRDGSRQLNSIQPFMIERIEVISGASSIYGSGATGGIINIMTKKNSEAPLSFETQLGMAAGEQFKRDALAYEISQSMQFNQDAFSGSLAASYHKRGEIQGSRGNRIGPEVAQTDRQDTETLDLNGRLNWSLADGQNLSIGAQYYNDAQGSDYGADYGQYGSYHLANLLFGTLPSLQAVTGLQLQKQPSTERWAINTQYRNENIIGNQQLNVEAYYRHEKGRWFPSISPLGHADLSAILAQRYPNYADPTSPDFLNAIRDGYAVLQSETAIAVWGARLALQKDFKLVNRQLALSYGIDYEQEKDQASATRFDFNDFYNSNGLVFTPIQAYAFGPDTGVKKIGTYVQGRYQWSDRINLQAGIRHERITSHIADSTPYRESIPSDILQGLAEDYTAKPLQGGQVKHNATLLNLGTVYHLTDAQQLFANFSQGFSLPDIQRMLRDVPASFEVSSNNIDPIKVNNYEIGWRLQNDSGLNVGLTAFYNDSDKVVQFNPAPAYNIEIIDTDERVYGAEARADYPISEIWNIGGTLAYTRGQFKNEQGDWQELDAMRIAPLKATLFSEWQFNDGIGLRVQSLAVDGTDKAREDFLVISGNSASKAPAKMNGFATMDVIANAKVGPGKLGLGINNVWNRDYKTVFSQAAAVTYGAMSSLPAQGRNYALSYTLNY